MKNYVLLSAAALMLSVVSVHAEDAAKPADKPAASKSGSPIDKNGDGMISKSEADDVAQHDFTAFDVDKNGKISKDEFQTLLFKANAKELPDDAAKKRAEPEVAAQYNMLDKNHDGAVTKAEFVEDATRRFKAMDENGDGKVTKAEVADVQSKIKAQIEKMKAAAVAKKGATVPAK